MSIHFAENSSTHVIQSPTHVAILELEYIQQDVRTIINTDRKNCTAKSLGLGLAQARPN